MPSVIALLPTAVGVSHAFSILAATFCGEENVLFPVSAVGELCFLRINLTRKQKQSSERYNGTLTTL